MDGVSSVGLTLRNTASGYLSLSSSNLGAMTAIWEGRWARGALQSRSEKRVNEMQKVRRGMASMQCNAVEYEYEYVYEYVYEYQYDDDNDDNEGGMI